MRWIIAILVVLLIGLQYRLWVSDHGAREVWRLNRAIESQHAENRVLADRNRALVAEVRDLKEGLDAIEERARTELGMVGEAETYYQVMPSSDDGSDPDPR